MISEKNYGFIERRTSEGGNYWSEVRHKYIRLMAVVRQEQRAALPPAPRGRPRKQPKPILKYLEQTHTLLRALTPLPFYSSKTEEKSEFWNYAVTKLEELSTVKGRRAARLRRLTAIREQEDAEARQKIIDSFI